LGATRHRRPGARGPVAGPARLVDSADGPRPPTLP
jgi:hypothetical protein